MTKKLILPFILLVVLGFGTIRLSESPTVWGDEGMIVELAVNFVRHGKMRTQIAPQTLTSSAFTTTGFPVIFPVALSLATFGIGILNARAVMVVYMLLCVGALYLLGKRVVGTKNAAYAALLVATFAPFYGNGKNVLGEIPGLFFLFAFLLCIHRLETSDKKRRAFYFLAGLTSGLCVVTKPIFLALLPAVIGAAILLRKKIERDITSLAFFILGFTLPVILWIALQFESSDSLQDVIAFYSNPYQVNDILGAITQNILRFFRESAPFYLLVLFIVWSISFLPRLWKNFREKLPSKSVTFVEVISYVFVCIILVAYLRMPGWYRYFFPAQIIVFLYAPSSLRSLFVRFTKSLAYIPYLVLACLIVFQAYQVAFHSWIATSYYSTFTHELNSYFKTVDSAKSFFLYNVPELVVFLPNDRYYQYLEMSEKKTGEEQITRLAEGIPNVLIMYDRRWDDIGQQFPLYREKIRIARYVIAERRKD